MSDNTNFERLMAARWLTEKTGSVHQLQLDQILAHSYLCVPQAEFGELKVSFDSRTKLVKVAILTKVKPLKGTQMRLELLANNIQSVLGDKWGVRVTKVGRTIFMRPPSPYGTE